MESVWRPTLPVDLHRTLAPLSRGRGDPTQRVAADGSIWRTTLAPTGPSTCRLTQQGPHQITCQAWGPGAEWAVASAPDLLGRRDTLLGFDPRHPVVERSHARHPGLRLPRTGRVFEALVPAILEQKVTGQQAKAAFYRLLRSHGTEPPGPAPEGMRVQPPAHVWAAIPSWEWYKAGVEPARSRTIVRAAGLVGRLEESVDLDPTAALARLRVVPGVGEWTAAEVAQRAFGDPDSLSVGDYHLSQFVGWAMVGRPLDDAEMVALLEPWRGHRQRVVRLLELSGATKPRFGPRLTIADHRTR